VDFCHLAYCCADLFQFALPCDSISLRFLAQFIAEIVMSKSIVGVDRYYFTHKSDGLFSVWVLIDGNQKSIGFAKEINGKMWEALDKKCCALVYQTTFLMLVIYFLVKGNDR
jgi:hypothetical protein